MVTVDTEFCNPLHLSPENKESFEELKTLLEVQAKEVISLRVLPNFGTDYDMTLKKGRKIIKGVQIQFRQTYVISYADGLWLHPSLCHVRSSYEIPVGVKVPQSNDFEGMYNRVGTYETSRVDEFGMSTVTHYVVIDTNTQSTTWDDIMSEKGVELQGVYDQLKDGNLTDNAIAFQKEWVRKHFGVDKEKTSVVYNVFCSNGDSIAFYNDCTSTKENNVYLVDQGPIHGYLEVSSQQVFENVFKNTLPLSLGVTTEFYKWKDLSEKHRAKFMDINWGNEQCSTPLMRMPLRLNTMDIEKWAATLLISISAKYITTSLSLSPHHVSSLLPVKTMLDITPSEREVIGIYADKKKHFADMYKKSNVCVPFTIESELVKSVLRDRVQIEKEFGVSILNPEICKENLIFLPRDVVKRYIK